MLPGACLLTSRAPVPDQAAHPTFRGRVPEAVDVQPDARALEAPKKKEDPPQRVFFDQRSVLCGLLPIATGQQTNHAETDKHHCV